MIRFYPDHGVGALHIDEINRPDQWGVRPGKTPDEDCLVVIDPGLDDDYDAGIVGWKPEDGV